MKVLYDYQIFVIQRYGGISRYFCELMKCWRKNGEVDGRVAALLSNNEYLHDAGLGRFWRFSPERYFKGRDFILINLNRALSLAALRRQNFDLFHPTYYDPYFLRHLGRKPFVLTVHDMTHERFPEMFSSDDPTREWKRLLVERAARIIAISGHTRDDLVAQYGVDPAKIRVIHHGPTLSPDAPAKPSLGLPGRYLLYVGDRREYKNFTAFVEAVAPLLHEDRQLEIVCTGGGLFKAGEVDLFDRLGIAGRVRQFSVADDFLAGVYRNARALVFPSLYEGFGFPVLEAFACGCPAALSNAGALPEVAGEAAVYFDPRDRASMLDAMQRACYDEVLREDLKRKGMSRLANFSWERTAAATKAVYWEILMGEG